jgi:hypothetical protein
MNIIKIFILGPREYLIKIKLASSLPPFGLYLLYYSTATIVTVKFLENRVFRRRD